MTVSESDRKTAVVHTISPATVRDVSKNRYFNSCVAYLISQSYSKLPEKLTDVLTNLTVYALHDCVRL